VRVRLDVEERLLERTGTLYTWTVQGFRPKPPYAGPEGFEPYGVGYVELPGEVRVEARLTVADPDGLWKRTATKLFLIALTATMAQLFTGVYWAVKVLVLAAALGATSADDLLQRDGRSWRRH